MSVKIEQIKISDFKWPFMATEHAKKLARTEDAIIFEIIEDRPEFMKGAEQASSVVYSNGCFTIDELAIKMLEQNMSRHDWYHAWSDDGSVFERGHAEITWIRSAIRNLTKRGHEAVVKQLWEQYAPSEFTMP